MRIYIFGNGNLSFEDYKKYYEDIINDTLLINTTSFIVCDFKGVDTLTMELLKSKSANAAIYHIGQKPRYFPDIYKTKASSWTIKGSFENDEDRDNAAINDCTHFIAIDFNSDSKRISGTQKNIDKCIELGKIRLGQ